MSTKNGVAHEPFQNFSLSPQSGEYFKSCLEDGGHVILFGGLAPFELEKCKKISIRGLCTEFGVLDFHYSDGELLLRWNKPVAADIKFVLPEYFMDKIRISVSE